MTASHKAMPVSSCRNCHADELNSSKSAIKKSELRKMFSASPALPAGPISVRSSNEYMIVQEEMASFMQDFKQLHIYNAPCYPTADQTVIIDCLSDLRLSFNQALIWIETKLALLLQSGCKAIVLLTTAEDAKNVSSVVDNAVKTQGHEVKIIVLSVTPAEHVVALAALLPTLPSVGGIISPPKKSSTMSPDSSVSGSTCRLPVLHSTVLEMISSVIEDLAGQSVAPTEPLMAAGLTSRYETKPQLGLRSVRLLHATELAQQLENQIGVQLSPTLMFDYPTIGAIAESIMEHLDNGRPVSPRAAVVNQHPLPDVSTDVVSMHVTLPGLVDVTSGLQDAIGITPSSRWDTEHVSKLPGFHPYLRFSAPLVHAELFDGVAFGISRLEAELMDPQQRLLLMAAHTSLEQARKISEI
eukprot:scaffold120720_cov51-Prasinocladus_malaysianus.AAC.5